MINAIDLDGNYTLPAGVLSVPILNHSDYASYILLDEASYVSLSSGPLYLLYRPRPNLHAIASYSDADVPSVNGWIASLLRLQEENPLLYISLGMRAGKPMAKSSNHPVMGLPFQDQVI